MDVTHINCILNKPYLGVLINTYSNFIWAVLVNSERDKAICSFLLECFSVKGVSNTIKTDNSLVFTSKTFQSFHNEWKIKHVKEIVRNPQGQTIVEHEHRTLKIQLLNNRKMGNSSTCFSILLFLFFKFSKPATRKILYCC